jgi:hypothetical protein
MLLSLVDGQMGSQGTIWHDLTGNLELLHESTAFSRATERWHKGEEEERKGEAGRIESPSSPIDQQSITSDR